MQTIGRTNSGNSNTYAGANYKIVSSFTAGATFTADRMVIRFTDLVFKGSAKIIGVVYADSSGAPGALLAQTTEKIGCGPFANTLYFSSPISISSGTVYWIGYITDTDFTYTYCQNSFGALAYNADTYAGGPADPFGTPTTAAKELSVYLISQAEVAISKALTYAVVSPPNAVNVAKVVVYAVVSSVTPTTSSSWFFGA